MQPVHQTLVTVQIIQPIPSETPRAGAVEFRVIRTNAKRQARFGRFAERMRMLDLLATKRWERLR
jgi:hypothetical protein